LNSFDLRATNDVLARLWTAWQNNDGAIRETLNVVAGDYVESTDIVEIAIEMNATWPPVPDAINRLGPEHMDTVPSSSFPAGSFPVTVSYQGQPLPYAGVTYAISPVTPDGPTLGGNSTWTVLASNGGVASLDNLIVGTSTGTWQLTAAVEHHPELTTEWTLGVVPPNLPVSFQPVAGNPTEVLVGSTVPDGFAVQARNALGDPLPGNTVTFDFRPTGGNLGVPGVEIVEVNTDADGIARSPAFTAGTHAGATTVVVFNNDPLAPISLNLPLTQYAGAATTFVPLTGDLQTTPINTTFPVPLTGHFLDQYGNVTTDVPTTERELGVGFGSPLHPDEPLATWPNGENITPYTAAGDGTIIAPALHAGQTVLDGPGFDDFHRLLVYAGPFRPNPATRRGGWRLSISPGPPAAVAVAGGDDQRTGRGQPFAQPLAARLTDAGGNPIPGAPVTFQVTSGSATFPALDLTLLAKITGDRTLLTHPAEPPRDSVSVPTDANGVATAPVLTAGQKVGQIVVTASASGAPAAKTALFTLSAISIPPTAPSITGLGNGDGQVSVAFSGATAGTSPITSYQVTATDVTRPGAPAERASSPVPVTASGPSSPIVVTGLTNGDTYVFSVTATSADGTSPPSAPSVPLNVGVAPVVVGTPADGILGRPYSSGFTVTGAPPPTVTQVSGDLPPGLSLGSNGALTGTPTQVGSFTFTVQATNPVGIASKTVTVTISASLGAEPPPPKTSLTPVSHDFGTVIVGARRSQAFTLANGGKTGLTVSAVALGGTGSGHFAIVSDGCSSRVVPAGRTCQVVVAFKPLSIGLKQASLRVSDDASGSPQTASLKGRGVPCPSGRRSC
jgi:hypothetical protein